jgi:hypothetical protein
MAVPAVQDESPRPHSKGVAGFTPWAVVAWQSTPAGSWAETRADLAGTNGILTQVAVGH